jgi:hypothetical protein
MVDAAARGSCYRSRLPQAQGRLMLKIRHHQMTRMLAGDDALLRLAIRQQVRGQHAYVVEDLPQNLFDRMVDGGVARARSFGLEAPSDLACFVLLMFEFGPEYWHHPAINQVLRDAGATPGQRLQQVVQHTPQAVWQELQATLYQQHWFPEAFEPDLHSADG